MTATINGIGTRYVGKSNIVTREGQCHSCNFYGALSSYDTRLCFVVIFIPIIPLGKKRILDECPSCRRHYVMDAEKYVEAKRGELVDSMQQYETAPTVENALIVHATMLRYNQPAEAESFRQLALERFPHDADLVLSLGSHLEQTSRFNDAIPFYERAYQIHPESTDARYQLARVRLFQGQLDDARQLLNFLEVPGASETFSLSLLETLALAYQNAGRHIEAVELFNHLHKEIPDVAKNYDFRKMVEKSEKSLQMPVSVLPKQDAAWWDIFNPKSSRFSTGQRNVAYGSAIAVLVLIGLFLASFYISGHRTLHVVSGLSKPVTIQIDGGSPQVVQSHSTFSVAEGKHIVQVVSPFKAQYNIDLESSFFPRIFCSPAWIVNVEGTAPLYDAQLYYAQRPTQPTKFTWHVGKTFVALDDINYAFTTPPNTVSVKGSQTIEKTQVALQTAVSPMQLASMINDNTAFLSFLEAHLSTDSENAGLSMAYSQFIERTGQIEHAKKFFEAGLARRPIEVNWHRMYQEFCEKLGQIDEMEKTYAKALSSEPNNGVICYLCSRIESDPEKVSALLDRAVATAPDSTWVQYAIGYKHRSEGNWPAALAAYEKAEKLGFDPTTIRGVMHAAKLAVGQGKKLIAEYKAILDADKTDYQTMYMLCDAYVHTGQRAEAFTTLDSWKTENAQLLAEPSIVSTMTAYRCILLYELGDFDAMLKEAKDQNDPLLMSYQSLYDITTLHPEQSEEWAQENKATGDAWGAMTRSISYKLAQKGDKSKEWLDDACAKLKATGRREQKVAELLQSAEAPESTAIEKLPMDETHKLLLLSALAQKFPGHYDRYADLASKLNVSLSPPYHLILKVFPKAVAKKQYKFCAKRRRGDRTGIALIV